MRVREIAQNILELIIAGIIIAVPLFIFVMIMSRVLK